MNVLFAEENISYDKLKELEVINGIFSETDVVIIFGANDDVNPLAWESSGTPISDIPNPHFAMDNTLMFFGDGKKMVGEISNAIKDLKNCKIVH